MREWCSCGAAIIGRRADVLVWRGDHRHTEPQPNDPFVPPQGGVSLVETNQAQSWEAANRIGFRPNED